MRRPWHIVGLGSATLAAALAMLPAGASAQTGVSVQGVVFDAEGAPISVAVVSLEGHGTTLTSDDGTFRFFNVPRGGYDLSVVTMGYAPATEYVLVLADDVFLEVSLDVSPVALDGIDVAVELIEVEGEVRDAERGFTIVDARILTNQGKSDDADAHGRFDLQRVAEGVPLQLDIRAFGYLPLDTIVVPTGDDDRYRFELEKDPVMMAMIAEQTRRLDERIGGLYSTVFHPMNREDLERYAGSATLYDVLLFEWAPYLDRIKCMYVDEELYPHSFEWQALTMGLLPEEVERIDFIVELSFQMRAGALMIYTKEFMKRLVANDMMLRPPIITPMTTPGRDDEPCLWRRPPI